MPFTRRELSLLLPALAAAQKTALPSKIYRFEDLPVKKNGENASRAIFDGQTGTGFPIEMHATEIAAGLKPHGSHKHRHDELVIVRLGTVEVTIAGRAATLGPGSVAYIAPNEEHGLRNTGATPAHYYICALGPKA
jgi:(S)-ureidoglycine aminohydrolase